MKNVARPAQLGISKLAFQVSVRRFLHYFLFHVFAICMALCYSFYVGGLKLRRTNLCVILSSPQKWLIPCHSKFGFQILEKYIIPRYSKFQHAHIYIIYIYMCMYSIHNIDNCKKNKQTSRTPKSLYSKQKKPRVNRKISTKNKNYSILEASLVSCKEIPGFLDFLFLSQEF